MAKRIAIIKRKTTETDISIRLNIDGRGDADIQTGIGFLDHMLRLFAKHGLFDLKVKAKGDLEVDLHHTNEDVGICLGQAFKKALGKKLKIRRFGTAFVPMDESLAKARVVLDVSGRPSLYFEKARAVRVGRRAGYTLQDTKLFFRAFCTNSGVNMHVDIFRGEDIHHITEAIFKALARALKEACSLDMRTKGLPTTKGKL